MKKLIVFIVVLCMWSVATAQPKIAFPGSPWEFGEMLQQQRVSHQFEVRNEGTDTLFISRVKPSCGCTSAPLTKDVIGPGESIWLDITFDSKRFSGLVSKKVTVFCNDPNEPQSVIQFSARVETARKLISLPDEPVELGNLLPNRPNQAMIRLTNVGTEPYRLVLADWPQEWMQTSWTEKVVDPEGTVELEIGTQGVAPLGKFESSLTIDIQGLEKTRMSIPISGIGLVD